MDMVVAKASAQWLCYLSIQHDVRLEPVERLAPIDLPQLASTDGDWDDLRSCFFLQHRIFWVAFFLAHFPTVVGERTPLFPLLFVSLLPYAKKIADFSRGNPSERGSYFYEFRGRDCELPRTEFSQTVAKAREAGVRCSQIFLDFQGAASGDAVDLGEKIFQDVFT